MQDRCDLVSKHHWNMHFFSVAFIFKHTSFFIRQLVHDSVHVVSCRASVLLEILLNPIEVLFLCLFIQGPQGRSGLPGLPGADGPPVSISDSCLLNY